MEVKQYQVSRGTFMHFTEATQALINSQELLELARRRPVDFTRQRKMGFTQLLTFMMNLVRTSTQTALDRFFDLIGHPETSMTQQSFSESRQKLNPEACRMLLTHSVSFIYEHRQDTWNGRTIIAIDGSKTQLPDEKKLLDVFGGTGRGATSPTAQVSFAYDILNNVVVDAYIEPLSTDERTLAKRHFRCITDTPGISQPLLILDRGYPSFDLIASVYGKMEFLMRVRRKFDVTIDAMDFGIHDHTLCQDGQSLKVRIVKFLLPSGETETLITNLAEPSMGIEAFKDLYFLRWPIETKYGEVKLKLGLENFSGKTEIAIRQDFYITVFFANAVSIAAHEAQPAIDWATAGKGNKYEYKVNVNHAIGTLKDNFIMALLERNPERKAKKCERIIMLVGKHAVPRRPNRSVPRNTSPRKSRYHHNMKSNC